ncbi:MAG: GNAT family N-acetyltransferase [Microbacteriaceae bacterium]
MYEVVARLPTVDEHRRLATSVGWEGHFDWSSIGRSLEGSTHGVVITSGGHAVAMGRIVGDGVHYFYLQDVIVHPEHSDAGLGSRVVKSLLAWIAEVAPATAFVGLFASPEAESLYEEFEFTTDDMTGMHRSV